MSANAPTLTENGILTDDPGVRREVYVGYYGEPVYEDEDRVVFADDELHELNEWADDWLDLDRSELSERMHELAREVYGRDESDGTGDPWGAVDPIVFDAETFEEADR